MRRHLFAIIMIGLMMLACSEEGFAQTWRSYPKTTGQGQLVIEGNYLWSAGEVLYRYDIASGAWRLFGRDDGLPENALNCIAVNSKGMLWLGTQDRGLWSFDGSQFRAFELEMPSAPESVSVLMIDPTDRIWFTKQWSLALWVSDGQMAWFYDESSGLMGRVKDITWGAGDTAWCATGQGIYRLDGDTWTEIKTGDYYAIFADSSGGVWAVGLIGPSYEVSRYDGDAWTTYPGISAGIFDGTPNGFSEAPDGTIWVGTGSGLARFDGEQWTNYKVGEGMPDQWPQMSGLSSTAADDNNVVYASCKLGIIRYDGQQWSIVAPDNSVPVYHITAACCGNNRLFFGTRGFGLGEFDGLQWRMDQEEWVSNADVETMLYDEMRDVTWYVGWSTGCFGPGAGSYTGGSDPNRPISGKCMTLDGENRLWVGSGGSVFCWDGDAWTKYTQEDGLLPTHIFTGIAAAFDGSIWAVGHCSPASMNLTASVFEDGAWTVKSFDLPGQAIDITSDALGGIWCLLEQMDGNYKVARLSLEGVGSEWDVAQGNWGLQKLLVSATMQGIWLVGEYGALRLVNDEWRLVTPADGLACGSVYSVAFAPHNVTWFCTGTSLCRLDESPVPWVRLYAAGGTGGTLDFAPGDTLDVQGELHNPMTERSVSIYVAVRLPNDPTLYFWPSFSTAPEPVFAGTLPDKLFLGPISLFTHTFSGAEPPGTYSILSAILSNETGEMIGEIEQVDLEFSAAR